MPTANNLWIAGCIACLTLAACGDHSAAFPLADASHATDALTTRSDASVVRAISQVEFNAIELSRLALHRSHSAAMLEFAKKMLEDHTRQRTGLRRAAFAHGIRIVTTMDTDGQNAWGALFVKSGAPFDEAFGEAVHNIQEAGQNLVAELQKRNVTAELCAWGDKAAELWEQESRALATF